MDHALTVLFPSVGRRIELLQAFRAAAQRLGVALKIIATDTDARAPGLFCADEAFLVPPIADPGYIPKLVEVAEQRRANLLVPTIDTDLPPISRHREQFAAVGCLPLIGEPAIIETCRDKIQTFHFLRRHGIDTPETYTPEQIRAQASLQFPYMLKPRDGSSSRGVHKLNDPLDLDYFLQRVRDPIVQEFVLGVEHTLDAYVGLDGVPRCIVPRRRWQVRGGEVSKGVVVKDPEIMAAGQRVVEALGASVRGLVTIQCIVTPERRVRFIEINPRFGGGAPLGIAAGADYPAWLIQEWLGQPPAIAPDGFRHGTCMLRYDWSVFVPLDADLRPQIRPPLYPCPPFE